MPFQILFSNQLQITPLATDNEIEKDKVLTYLFKIVYS